METTERQQVTIPTPPKVPALANAIMRRVLRSPFSGSATGRSSC